MTAADIIEEVRRQVSDNEGGGGASQTWKDSEYVPFVNQAQHAIFRDHPESQLAAAGTLITLTEVAAKTTVIVIDDIYKEPLVAFVAWKFFASDDKDQADKARAKKFQDEYDKYFTAG